MGVQVERLRFTPHEWIVQDHIVKGVRAAVNEAAPKRLPEGSPLSGHSASPRNLSLLCKLDLPRCCASAARLHCNTIRMRLPVVCAADVVQHRH